MQNRTLVSIFIVLFVGAVLAFLSGLAVERPGPASAGGFTVNNTADMVDADLNDDVCDVDLDTEGPQCTLRAAVQQANANNGPDSISLPDGTYTLTIPIIGQDSDAEGDLDLTDDLSIDGAAAAAVSGQGVVNVIIQAGPAPGSGIDRVFEVQNGTSAEFTGVDIRHGSVEGARGGGIYNHGTLTLTNVTVGSNEAPEGGGIFNEGGSVDIIDSTLSNNSAGIDGGGMYNESGSASLDGSTVAVNIAESNGGGINSEGNGASLLVQDSVISDNTAGEFNGGGIDAEGANGTLNVVESVIVDNTTGSNGGGIYIFSGTEFSVFGSSISANQAGFHGGGIYFGGTGPVSLTDSTVDGNTANSFGGGIYSWKNATLVNMTISTNSAASDGGGVYVRSVTTITNSTIAGNTADSNTDGSGDGGGLWVSEEEGTALLGKSIVGDNMDPTSDPDCFGFISSQGFNLVETVSVGCEISGNTSGNITGEDPLLGPLVNNGGPTPTHALLPDSPAIDAVTQGCPPPPADQRGVTRPQGPACDMGAFELEPGQGVIWGDHNCSGAPDPIDALLNLRHDAGLTTETGDCPEMGEDVNIQGSGPEMWGDLDCNGAADPVDGLKILRYDAGLDVARPPDCPDPGEAVTIQ